MSSTLIGEMVISLAKIDDIAYIRFCSVYRPPDRKMSSKIRRMSDYGQPRKIGSTRMPQKEFPWAQYKPRRYPRRRLWITEEINLQCNYAPFIGKRSDSFCRLCTMSYPSEYEAKSSPFLNYCR